MGKQVAKAVEAKQIDDAKSLVDQIRSLIGLHMGIYNKCETLGDHRTANAALREVRATLEVLLKVSGELKGDQTVVNIAVVGNMSDEELVKTAKVILDETK
jgi:hypothetical protein